MHRKTSLALLLLLAAPVGCEKKPAQSPDPGAATPTPADPAASATPPATDTGEKKWADMDRAGRKRFMGVTVFPAMKKLFQDHNAGEYQGFKCQTCHGDDWTKPEVDFKMPMVAFPLSADDPIKTGRDYDAKVTAFMVDAVMPTMADLLGKKYDKTTGKGEFGCLSCHPSA